MIIETAQAITTGLDLWEHRGKLASSLRKFWSLVRKGKQRIALFGPGGVGKTTTAKFLAGSFDPLTFSASYDESLTTEDFSLKGDIVCSLIVPPGQERRRDRTWGDIYEILAEGKINGIINLVAFGYHSFWGFSYKETKYYQENMTKEDFVEAYLKARQAKEMDILRELMPRLSDAKKAPWMITLVNKQDLWWAERQAVRKHYMEGEYNALIEQIVKTRGAKHFAHEYLSSSIVISNFATSHGELLAPTTQGYDQTLQLVHLHRLIDTINAFTN